MFRNKRDVDRHVADLAEKVPSEVERALKSFTIAKLYYGVGEYEMALKQLDKYAEVRSNSAPAYKLRGVILEAMGEKHRGATEGSSEEQYALQKKYAAIEAYKLSIEMDMSQKELVLKVCDLMTKVPIKDPERTRYWVEQGEKFYPKSPVVKKLKEKMKQARGGEEDNMNGNNGLDSINTSPNSQQDNNVEADNSILWSTARIGAASVALNGSYRLEDLTNTSTPREGHRFVPRPSPERLASQVKSVEVAQEKMAACLAENSRMMVETQEAMLGELRKTREDTARNLRENTEAIKDLRSEVTSIWREMREEMRKHADRAKEVVVLKKEEKGPAAPEAVQTPAGKPLELHDLQEALAQQAALIQMSSLGMAGMFAQATRPPHVNPQMAAAMGVLPGVAPVMPQARPGFPSPGMFGNQTNNPWPTGSPMPQQPVAQQQQQQNNATPKNVVITSSDKIPTTPVATPALSAVSIPPQHRLGGTTTPVQAMSTPTTSVGAKPATPGTPGTPMTSYMTPPESGFKTHGYHINMPKGVSPLTTSPFADQDGPAVPITTTSILSTVPAPMYSAVSNLGHSPDKSGFNFSFSSGGRQRQASICSQKSHDGSHVDDEHHDPHFEPIIPLPEEVEVITGEEDEDVLHEDRCKLYRFVNGEWKERGLGQIKILRHKLNKKIRILMRREQTHKVCANHFLFPDITIAKMKNQDKAATWVANDFSDEEIKMETLSARFKTPEQAENFMDQFNAAKATAPKSSPQKQDPTKDKKVESVGSFDQFKPKAGSWECQGCFVRNEADKIQCPACQTAKPGHEQEVKAKEEASKPSMTFGVNGGFKFNLPASTMPTAGFGSSTTTASSGFGTSTPTASSGFGTSNTTTSSGFGTSTTTSLSGFSFNLGGSAASAATTTTPVTTKEETKPSPFAGFSFGTSPAATTTPTIGGFGSSTTTTLGGFGSTPTTKTPEKSSFTFSLSPAGRQRQTSVSSQKSHDGSHVDEEHHDPHFEPIIPLPEEVEIVTGEEDEDVLHEDRCKLYRFVNGEWKERGLGQIKILRHKKSSKVRILMRRDQTHKVCSNHFLLPEMTIDAMKNQEKAAIWVANDFSDEEARIEKLSARFKTPDQAKNFIDQFNSAKATVPNNVASSTSPAKEEKKIESVGSFDQFKPKVGSWECQGCFVRNDADKIQCPACQTAKPGHEQEVKAKEEASKPTMTFGVDGGFKFNIPSSTSTTTAPPAGGFVFGETSKPAEAKPAFSFGTQSGVQDIKASASEADELSFEGQGLKLNNEKDAEGVVAKIKEAKTIKTLTFSGNTIGIDAAKVIGKALETHPEFCNAHWRDMFTGRMKTEIPPALKHLGNGIMTANAKLVELDLSDNAFGPIGMEGVVDLLKSPSCFTLKVLKLNNTGCGVTGGKLLAKTLMECYKASKGSLALKVFVLGRSRQENEGAMALAEVFKLMGSLEEVVMPQNGIYHVGLSALSDAFSCNPNLRILNMNDNTFTEQGAAALAKALPNLQKLKVLNLGDCLLKTKGAKLIASALKEGHQDLEELYMDSNEIWASGGLAIAEAVGNKPNITKLVIDTNQFGPDGCEQILQKLEDIGKRDIMEDIEDDEEPDSDEENDDEQEEDDEEEEEEEDEEEKQQKDPVSFFSFTQTTPRKDTSNIFGGSGSGGSGSGSKSIFGGLANTASATVNLFGGASKDTSASPSLFGGGAVTTTTPSPNTSSIFGGKPANSGGIFGTPASKTTGGIFGSNVPDNSKGSSSTPATNMFGQPKSESTSKGVDLSASKDLPSFSNLGSGNGNSAFGKKTDGFAFAGAGSSVFGVKSPGKKSEGGSEAETGDDHHDPHFEPIIPLPELVHVTTGEEEEEVMFKHRAKVYRYDPDTKQWKERGVGDIKILFHPDKKTYRVLLRRDQVHKIACNHYINLEQQLKPLSSSETALTWFAMDYCEGSEEGKMENLAVKFKLADTKDEFQKVFEAAQETLRSGGGADGTSVHRARPANKDDVDDDEDDETGNGNEYDDDDDEEDDEDDDDEEDESEDSDNVMFDHQCSIYEVSKSDSSSSNKEEKLLGKCDLRILYDDDVFGARIVATNNDNSDLVYCNHLIAMQTSLEVQEANKKCYWSALDFSADPPLYRSFMATFEDAEAVVEFTAMFTEGKELAEQSEILEQPTGRTLDPNDLYYGQGGEYEEDES